jgi:hypothetical protein
VGEFPERDEEDLRRPEFDLIGTIFCPPLVFVDEVEVVAFESVRRVDW